MQTTAQTNETTAIVIDTAAQAVETTRTLTALELCTVGGGRGSVSLE
jgi:hypothetical protein